jgi:hypothetical protein
MKKVYIFSILIIIIGLLIALGPQFLFKVCGYSLTSTMNIEDTNNCGNDDTCGCGNLSINYSICHWSAQAELGIGMLIIALGACLIVFNDIKIQLGLYIGVFFSSLIALFIPNALIGGCNSMDMACRKVAFPALTIESVTLLIFSSIIITYIIIRKLSNEKPKELN